MKKLLIISLAISILISCKEKSIETNNNTIKNSTTEVLNTNNEVVQLDFLKSLQEICIEDDGIFKNCDELFTKDGSSLFFLIIPKSGAKNWYDIQSKNLTGEIYEVNNKLIDKVKNVKKESLSQEFNVWVFYIDKKYTQFVGLDSPYNIKTPRLVDLYFLKSGVSNWEKIESFNVQNEKDSDKENKWRSNFITKTIEESNSLKSTSNNQPISKKWHGKYSAYFDYGKIGGDNAGWGLELEINKNEIKASGDGYQISFSDLLSAKENDNKLILNHLKNISGYKQGADMNPEFELIEKNGKYYIKSKWIDSDIVTRPLSLGYEIDKE